MLFHSLLPRNPLSVLSLYYGSTISSPNLGIRHTARHDSDKHYADVLLWSATLCLWLLLRLWDRSGFLRSFAVIFIKGSNATQVHPVNWWNNNHSVCFNAFLFSPRPRLLHLFWSIRCVVVWLWIEQTQSGNHFRFPPFDTNTIIIYRTTCCETNLLCQLLCFHCSALDI